ncbi:Signal transduction histidine kinase [Ruminococcus sp. YE71]|nr:Signal transduction histidine kinase [Ruminococcus sp. YE78]SFW27297.1 Signal transduction histidine kinase [Ruminococcus sp. YE71]
MIERRSLLFKYFLICTAVILISFIALGAVLLLISSNYFNGEKEEKMKRCVGNVSNVIVGNLTSMPDEWTRVSQYAVNEYSKNTGCDLLLFSSDGSFIIGGEVSELCEPLKYSKINEDFIEQFGDSPTSVRSDFGGLLNRDVLTVGKMLSGNGPKYLLVAVNSEPSMNNYTHDIMEIFALSATIVLGISMAIIYLSSIKLTAPINEMSEAAKKIGRGDFDIQLPGYPEKEYNDLASAFNEMAASLKSYDTMRNSFIANVSHELRTPMTSIGGFVDGMLDKTIPPEEQDHYLKIISSEVQRLTRLVRSMLNLAKIEAGELKPNFTQFSVLDPIIDTLVTFEKRLEAKHIEVRGLDTDKRYYLWADSDLVHQVVYNLLENAIKFVDDGGYISFHFEEIGYLTVIYIRNSGEGLSQEELSLVFDRFYKTDKSRGMDAMGVGLGLNIVKSIIRLHGGKIQVRSVVNEYTEFMFSLPNKDIS